MRKLGLIAFLAVSVQGILGGLRVVKMKDEIGIFHAILAQAFLCLLVAMTVFLSKWWQRNSTPTAATAESAQRLKPLILLTTAIIFIQLALGASMRHQHAGLAVPDFPLAYGKIWPATDPASIQRYNQLRIDDTQYNAITAGQIHLHMTHRILACLILGFVASCWIKTMRHCRTADAPLESRRRGNESFARTRVGTLTTAWLGLILLQAGLGVVTVLKNKPADIATAHVVVGAASLALGALISIMLARLAQQRAPQEAAALKPAFAGSN